MDTEAKYSFRGLIAREATLRAGLARFPMATFDKLRFGLAYVPVTDELLKLVTPGPEAREVVKRYFWMSPHVVELGSAVSRFGPVVFVEARTEHHIGVAWSRGNYLFGPDHLDTRDPINGALAKLGFASPPRGIDAMHSLGLDERKDAT